MFVFVCVCAGECEKHVKSFFIQPGNLVGFFPLPPSTAPQSEHTVSAGSTMTVGWCFFCEAEEAHLVTTQTENFCKKYCTYMQVNQLEKGVCLWMSLRGTRIYLTQQLRKREMWCVTSNVTENREQVKAAEANVFKFKANYNIMPKN